MIFKVVGHLGHFLRSARDAFLSGYLLVSEGILLQSPQRDLLELSKRSFVHGYVTMAIEDLSPQLRMKHDLRG